MSTLEKLLHQAQALAPEDQLRLITLLCEGLRTKLHPQVVPLEGRWADLPFDEEGIDRAIEELRRRSWEHLEAESGA